MVRLGAVLLLLAVSTSDLTIEPISAAKVHGCSGFDWRTSFRLASPASVDGHIVQKVTRVEKWQPCNSQKKKTRRTRYWEAWPVRQGFVRSEDFASKRMHYDDKFFGSDRPGTRGKVSMTALARFYAGQTLPRSMKPGRVKEAGDLASTRRRPRFWADNDGTVRELHFEWDCCSSPSKHRLRTIPAEAE